MNNEIVIEKNVPIPIKNSMGTYPFHLLEIGDSFKVLYDKEKKVTQQNIHNMFRSFCVQRKLNWKCIVRNEGEYIRIWRIDPDKRIEYKNQFGIELKIEKDKKPKPSNKYNFGQMQINDSFYCEPREGQNIKALRSNIQHSLKSYCALNNLYIEIVCRYEGKGIRTWRIK